MLVCDVSSQDASWWLGSRDFFSFLFTVVLCYDHEESRLYLLDKTEHRQSGALFIIRQSQDYLAVVLWVNPAVASEVGRLKFSSESAPIFCSQQPSFPVNSCLNQITNLNWGLQRYFHGKITIWQNIMKNSSAAPTIRKSPSINTWKHFSFGTSFYANLLEPHTDVNAKEKSIYPGTFAT